MSLDVDLILDRMYPERTDLGMVTRHGARQLMDGLVERGYRRARHYDRDSRWTNFDFGLARFQFTTTGEDLSKGVHVVFIKRSPEDLV